MSDWRNNFRKLNAVKGWILDVYSSEPNEVTVWIIGENGEYTHRIYVAGSYSLLQKLAEKIRDSESVASYRFVEKYADFREAMKKKVLEIDMTDYGRTSFFARKILRLGSYENFQLYVDVPIAQAYLYERDVFPLANVLVADSGSRLSYELLDSVESCKLRYLIL